MTAAFTFPLSGNTQLLESEIIFKNSYNSICFLLYKTLVKVFGWEVPKYNPPFLLTNKKLSKNIFK